MPRILIMTPSARNPAWGYIRSVEGMEAYIRSNGINYKHIASMERITETQCSNLSQGRQNMLDIAINEGFTHGIFIDDDMDFPSHILDTMFSTLSSSPGIEPATGIEALGVNALRKDATKMAYTATNPDGTVMDTNTISMFPSTLANARPALTCGLGFFIIDIDAVKKVPPPHFEVHWCPVNKGYIGEDRFFTSKLRAHGVKTYIDHGASKVIGHIGDFNYNYDSMRHKA